MKSSIKFFQAFINFLIAIGAIKSEDAKSKDSSDTKSESKASISLKPAKTKEVNIEKSTCQQRIIDEKVLLAFSDSTKGHPQHCGQANGPKCAFHRIQFTQENSKIQNFQSEIFQIRSYSL